MSIYGKGFRYSIRNLYSPPYALVPQVKETKITPATEVTGVIHINFW